MPASSPFAVLTRRKALLGAAAAVTLSAAPAGVVAAQPATRLVVDRRTLEVNRRPASVYSLAPAAGQRLSFTRGKNFAVMLDNRLDEATLVHWHGLTPPTRQDGTPGLSQSPLPAGASYGYDFPLERAGTFWMHSHVGLQRARLLAAPLIVADPADAHRDEQEVVLFLCDFSFRASEEILAGLTGGHGAMHGMAGMAPGAMDHDAMDHGGMHDMPRADMTGMGGMAGDMAAGPDVNDIDFDAYLANDRTLADPQVVRVAPGGRLRLRVINGAAATNFWIECGGLWGAAIAVDGNPLKKLFIAQCFPLAIAQRIDIRLQLPPGRYAVPVLARREGAAERTGIVLAPKGAPIAKISPKGETPRAPLDLTWEGLLEPAQPLGERKVNRALTADLTGDMTSYRWGINGKPYGEDKPLTVRAGERVELVLRNRTTMSHPMHLHGHRFQVVAIGGRRIAGAVRDTILVPAKGSVTVAFDADNPGQWALHCHNEYHMAAGMMTTVLYET